MGSGGAGGRYPHGVDPGVLLAGLDDGQRRAVTAPAGPICVLAGAGSGKTRVLTRRIAYRSAIDDADAGHVLALTFTRKAAGELAQRLAAFGLRERPTTGTFHAVAWAQLHAHWKATGRPAPALVERKGRILGPLLGKVTRMSVGELAAEIEWARARLITPERYPLAAAQAERRTGLPGERVATLYERYEAEKQQRRVLDFDDLLERCADALEGDHGFAQAQRWRFRHLFVDEFQDVNPLQHRLLEAWLGDRTDLCVVGDPNQAIYRWNGADASFLLGFATRYAEARVVDLVDNYRSTPEILGVAAAVLDGGSGQGRRLRAHRPSGPIPTVVTYPSEADEARGIARATRDHHQPGGRWGRQAILVRTNAQTALIEQALRQARIPYRVKGAMAFMARPEVRAALAAVGRSRHRLPIALDALQPEPVDDRTLTDHERDERENVAALITLGREFLALEPEGSAQELRWWLSATVAADDPGRQADAVELVTFHAAKGLEWPVVHLAGLEDGLVPISHARSIEAQAEETRLLYVAITRAEEELRCTWAERRTFGEREVARRPSPHLAHITGAAATIRATTADIDHDRGIALARAQLDVTHHHGSHADLVHALHDWRDRVARRANVPATVVLGDATLAEVAEQRPSTEADLAAVEGLGPVKAAEYGATLLALVAEHGTRSVDTAGPAAISD